MRKNKGGRPKKYNNVAEMQILIDAYFLACDKKREIIKNDKGIVRIIEEPYTVSGLCLALGICRDTLLEYEKLEEYSDAIKQAKRRVENWTEKKALTGQANPAFAIFSLKNNFGWKDKIETEHSTPDGRPFETKKVDDMTDEELNNRILELTAKIKNKTN